MDNYHMLHATSGVIPEASHLHYENQGSWYLELMGLLCAKGQLDLLAVGSQLQVSSHSALVCLVKERVGLVALWVLELLLVAELLLLETGSLGGLLAVVDPLPEPDLLGDLLLVVVPLLELHSQEGCAFGQDTEEWGLLAVLLLVVAVELLDAGSCHVDLVGLS